MTASALFWDGTWGLVAKDAAGIHNRSEVLDHRVTGTIVPTIWKSKAESKEAAMFSRRSTITLWLALLALLAVFASPAAVSASDQNHFQPVSPEELAMKSEPQ